ncbi:MAG: toxin HicA [Chloroflexi bacterium]|nr:toxin HicA [Chloroflexota bacterium]
MKANPAGIKYAELCKVCDDYFGKPTQKSTSHRRYKTPWPGDPRVNIQNKNRMAKPYQVKQVLKAIQLLAGG